MLFPVPSRGPIRVGALLALVLFASSAPAQFVLNEELVPSNGMDDAALTPDGRYGIVRQNGGFTTARIYDLDNGSLVLTQQSSLPHVGGVAQDSVVANDTRAAVAGTSLMLFDLTNLGGQALLAEHDVGWRPRDLALTPDGSLLAVRGGSGQAGGNFLVDAQTGALVASAAGEPPDYPSGQHSFDVDSVAVSDDHAIFTSVREFGGQFFTQVTIFDLTPQGGGVPQLVYETSGPQGSDQAGAPHDLAISPDGSFCAVRSELEVACYALNSAASNRLWSSRLAGAPGGFGNSALDSIEVTNTRIATISRQSNPSYPLGAQLDLFDLAGNQVFDRVSGDPNDLALNAAGTRLVVRTHEALYLYDLTTWPAGQSVSALDSTSPAVGTHTSWGAGLDSVVFGDDQVVSLFRQDRVTEIFTHAISGGQFQLVGQHTLNDRPVDLALTPDGRRCAVTGLASVAIVDLNTGSATFEHQVDPTGSWPWCDGVVANDERVLAFGVAGTALQGWVSVIDLFDDQVSYCPSAPNSSGEAAQLYAFGSPSIASNDLGLRCTGAPPGQVGWFAYGDLTATAPFGQGTLCLGGQVARFGPQFVDAAGLVTLPLDNGRLPPTGGLLTPGSTWRFQFLFKDFAGGSLTANSSDGLELLFTN